MDDQGAKPSHPPDGYPHKTRCKFRVVKPPLGIRRAALIVCRIALPPRHGLDPQHGPPDLNACHAFILKEMQAPEGEGITQYEALKRDSSDPGKVPGSRTRYGPQNGARRQTGNPFDKEDGWLRPLDRPFHTLVGNQSGDGRRSPINAHGA